MNLAHITKFHGAEKAQSQLAEKARDDRAERLLSSAEREELIGKAMAQTKRILGEKP